MPDGTFFGRRLNICQIDFRDGLLSNCADGPRYLRSILFVPFLFLLFIVLYQKLRRTFRNLGGQISPPPPPSSSPFFGDTISFWVAYHPFLLLLRPRLPLVGFCICTEEKRRFTLNCTVQCREGCVAAVLSKTPGLVPLSGIKAPSVVHTGLCLARSVQKYDLSFVLLSSPLLSS